MTDADVPETNPDPDTSPPATGTPPLPTDLDALRSGIARVVLGQPAVIDQVLVTLLCGGHALLEGVPGTAKTLTVRTVAALLSLKTRRIQFTPDLMPADIIGTNVFNMQQQAFELRAGPIFADFVIADEINRAPAKTQSALLEAMSEAHATIDGVRHKLSDAFTVFATQNPVEFEGTYPLPEAQQDRFLLKIRLDYPPADAERAVLQAVHEGRPPTSVLAQDVPPVLNLAGLLALRQRLGAVRVDPGVMNYTLSVVRATRNHPLLLLGAGPRGSMALLQTAKARALLQGRDYVSPDDVVAMVLPTLGHRIVLNAEAEVSGETTDAVLRRVLDQIDVPR